MTQPWQEEEERLCAIIRELEERVAFAERDRDAALAEAQEIKRKAKAKAVAAGAKVSELMRKLRSGGDHPVVSGHLAVALVEEAMLYYHNVPKHIQGELGDPVYTQEFAELFGIRLDGVDGGCTLSPSCNVWVRSPGAQALYVAGELALQAEFINGREAQRLAGMGCQIMKLTQPPTGGFPPLLKDLPPEDE
jgi:hypothetical protein